MGIRQHCDTFNIADHFLPLLGDFGKVQCNLFFCTVAFMFALCCFVESDVTWMCFMPLFFQYST